MDKINENEKSSSLLTPSNSRPGRFKETIVLPVQYN